MCSFKRDGMSCPLTNLHFRPHDTRGVEPVLAHVIPHALHEKVFTPIIRIPYGLIFTYLAKCIALFTGTSTRNEIMKYFNDISNAMNLEMKHMMT